MWNRFIFFALAFALVNLITNSSCYLDLSATNEKTNTNAWKRLLSETKETTEEFEMMSVAFSSEKDVEVIQGYFYDSSHDGYDDDEEAIPVNGWIHLSPVPRDRSCLLPPPVAPERSFTVHIRESMTSLLQWANCQAGTHRTRNGLKTALGDAIDEAVLKQQVVVDPDKRSPPLECPRVSAADIHENENLFIRNYWLKQRPVIISDYLTSAVDLAAVLPNHFTKQMGVKLSDSSDFEGVEAAELWEHTSNAHFRIPDAVLEQLVAPDKVVVRAAHEEMSFRSALSAMIKPSNNALNDTSSTAYIEYQSLQVYEDLLADLLQGRVRGGQRNAPFLPSWLAGKAIDAATHLWLGDGTTVGKLHFDRPDNILVQIAGKKQFKLLPPEASIYLQEGHMREAQLGSTRQRRSSFASDGGQRTYLVKRESLSDSTSLVHTPFSVEEAEQFGIGSVTCTVSEGEALFVPSFWWHEVASTPSANNFLLTNLTSLEGSVTHMRLNLAVNYWFEPLFDKSFPCRTCRKYFNVKYENVSRITEAILDAAEGTDFK